jgi:hypothetical protein
MLVLEVKRDASIFSTMRSELPLILVVDLQDLDQELKCPICLSTYTETMITSECMHRFCRECIGDSLRLGYDYFIAQEKGMSYLSRKMWNEENAAFRFSLRRFDSSATWNNSRKR